MALSDRFPPLSADFMALSDRFPLLSTDFMALSDRFPLMSERFALISGWYTRICNGIFTVKHILIMVKADELSEAIQALPHHRNTGTSKKSGKSLHSKVHKRQLTTGGAVTRLITSVFYSFPFLSGKLFNSFVKSIIICLISFELYSKSTKYSLSSTAD